MAIPNPGDNVSPPNLITVGDSTVPLVRAAELIYVALHPNVPFTASNLHPCWAIFFVSVGTSPDTAPVELNVAEKMR